MNFVLVKVLGKERVDEIGKNHDLYPEDQRILFDILGELGYKSSSVPEKEKIINRKLRNHPRVIQIKSALAQVIHEYAQLNRGYRKQRLI